jgi:hypothetical protein
MIVRNLDENGDKELIIVCDDKAEDLRNISSLEITESGRILLIGKIICWISFWTNSYDFPRFQMESSTLM